MTAPTRTQIARIAQRSGLDAAGAAALVAMQPGTEAEARELARLFLPAGPRHESAGGAIADQVPDEVYRRLASLGNAGPQLIARGDLSIQAQPPVGSEFYYPPERDVRRVTSLEPTRARVPELVGHADDIAGELVHVVHETDRDEQAGGVPRGAALPHAHVTLDGEDRHLGRWGSTATVGADAFRDPGNARRTFERFVRDVSMRALELDMLHGDGSETAGVKRLTGITETAGVASIARTTESRLQVLTQAATGVTGREWPPPLQVVINPTDLQALIDEEEAGGARVREVLELAGVDELVPSPRITLGTAIVGAWRQAATLLTKGPFELHVWNQHADYAARRLLLLELSTFAEFDVMASGFTIVTGL